MSGVTKHIYEREISDILKMWNNEIKAIEGILQAEYNKDDLILLLKKYYPHEWKSVDYKYEYYETKERFIVRHKGYARYNMPQPQKLLEQSSEYKKIMSFKWQKEHMQNYSYEKAKEVSAIRRR